MPATAQHLTDITEARHRVRAWRDRGVSFWQIEQATGVSRRTLSDVDGRGRDGLWKRLNRAHAAAICSIPLDHEFGHRPMTDRTGIRKMPVDSTKRRMSELAEAGYSATWCSMKLKGGKGRLRLDRPHVSVETAQLVARAHRLLVGGVAGHMSCALCQQNIAEHRPNHSTRCITLDGKELAHL